MQQVTLYSPAKAGTTVTLDTSNYQYVTFTAPALAGGETCSVSVLLPDGQTAVAARDVNGTNTGLTASVLTRTFFGGPTYKLVLSATASNCGLYADFGGKVT
jgi:hypothetical protein